MCRSIKTLRTTDGPAPPDEIEAAALQFVRKVSGMRHPAPRNEAAFSRAVEDVARASRELLAALPPKRVAASRAPSGGTATDGT